MSDTMGQPFTREPRPSAGVSSLVAPVPPVGLDAVAGQDIAGVESDDRHLALVDDRQDSPSGVGGADLEMVQPAGAAEGDPPDRPVGPVLVVVEAERIEPDLQLALGPGGRLTLEPALQGLVEALDLALGLGMTGRPVLLADAEVGEQPRAAVRSPRRLSVAERLTGADHRFRRSAA